VISWGAERFAAVNPTRVVGQYRGVLLISSGADLVEPLSFGPSGSTRSADLSNQHVQDAGADDDRHQHPEVFNEQRGDDKDHEIEVAFEPSGWGYPPRVARAARS
jgi:hypothetical protein